MRYHKYPSFHHKNMKLLVLLFSLSAIQCVYALGMDTFNTKLKSGKTTFKCSFQFELSGSEVSSAKVQCTPRNKKAEFKNLKLKGNLAEYLISFCVKPTKIIKVSTIYPCPLGCTQICTFFSIYLFHSTYSTMVSERVYLFFFYRSVPINLFNHDFKTYVSEVPVPIYSTYSTIVSERVCLVFFDLSVPFNLFNHGFRTGIPCFFRFACPNQPIQP
jgi:hypothetical protein